MDLYLRLLVLSLAQPQLWGVRFRSLLACLVAGQGYIHNLDGAHIGSRGFL